MRRVKLRGRPFRKSLAVRKDESAEIVRGAVGAIVAALELDAGAHRVHAAHVIQVRRQLDVLLVDAAGDLRAAARDAVEHADRLRFEHATSTRCDSSRSCSRVFRNMFVPIGPVSCMRTWLPLRLVRIGALGEIESADAEIAARRIVLRVADAQHRAPWSARSRTCRSRSSRRSDAGRAASRSCPRA